MITENGMEHRDETEWNPVPRQKLWRSKQEDKGRKQGGKNIIREKLHCLPLIYQMRNYFLFDVRMFVCWQARAYSLYLATYTALA